MENKGKYPIGEKGKNFNGGINSNKKPHRGEKEKKERKGKYEGIEKTSMGKKV